MKERSPITTHILDLNRGRPAAQVPVTLELQSAPQQWKSLAKGQTNSDGRVEDLLPGGTALAAGLYRLTFETAAYFSGQGAKTFYPIVVLVFEITAPKEHHHVPLLLNANGYTTYRGS
jgi:5-hydroxyisourate hydrolase